MASLQAAAVAAAARERLVLDQASSYLPKRKTQLAAQASVPATCLQPACRAAYALRFRRLHMHSGCFMA